ncbi:septation protein A [Candidatus Profftia tarda]|nr:septation protein A [Candidatus Profftia tarda]
MKKLLYFLPLAVFFIFYKIYDIYYASGALIIATAIDVILTWLRDGKVKKITLITFFMVVVSSTLTLVFHNDLFIKWKVSIVYMLFSIGLILSQRVCKKPLIRYLLNIDISLPDVVWYRLNNAWSLFFMFCAIANICVALWTPQNVWVNFKVFGLTALTLINTLLSGIYIYFHMPKNSK